jgi:hypothetical protein
VERCGCGRMMPGGNRRGVGLDRGPAGAKVLHPATANEFAATTTRNPPSRIGGPGVRASAVRAQPSDSPARRCAAPDGPARPRRGFPDPIRQRPVPPAGANEFAAGKSQSPPARTRRPAVCGARSTCASAAGDGWIWFATASSGARHNPVISKEAPHRAVRRPTPWRRLRNLRADARGFSPSRRPAASPRRCRGNLHPPALTS